MTSVMLIAGLALLIIGAGLGILIRKKVSETGADEARKAVEAVIAEAKKEAEAIKREAETIKKDAEIQAKDRLYQSKQELDKARREFDDSRKEFDAEFKERRTEAQALEKRVQQKEESLDKKFESIERKETDIGKKEAALAQEEKKLKDAEAGLNSAMEAQRRKLEEISGMTSEDAKKHLLDLTEVEARHDAGKLLKRIEDETKEIAEKKAKDIISLAIQRYSGDYVSERTVSIVHLPSDEMKGRIIGREGRNIRAIEAITGIDIIIDDTPEAIILSGHNPVRREIARQAIERLVHDGRIHPARIEEGVHKVESEVEKTIVEAGEKAIFDTGILGVHAEVQKLVGRLKYRTSYAQNVYAHSLEVSFICGIMASELGLPTKIARRAGLLHDIGKAVDHEVEGPHALIGADLAKKYGEKQEIVDAIGQHHDDRPSNIYGVLVQAADTLSAARPGARREMYEAYVKRLEDLEKIAKDFKGVEKSYALQAGREVRVIVEGSKIDDSGAVTLSRDIAKKIETDLTYPGQIKITVIRETRAVDYAR
ncbi:MAG TPA: ribonuclease Y [Thermodesulfobacteriota bacterium]|nr:ribonuclease Y [Thermodesulfobacteriota bacterium]